MTTINGKITECAGMTILVVEDMTMIATEIARRLRSAGCDVLGPYPTLDDGLRAIQSDPPPRIDAALLDINLGGEQCYPIAEVLEGRHVPFAFLTGYTSEYLPDRFSESPVLEKPFSRADLDAVVRRLLNDSPQG